jgi:hypothetical protein
MPPLGSLPQQTPPALLSLVRKAVVTVRLQQQQEPPALEVGQRSGKDGVRPAVATLVIYCEPMRHRL